MWDVWKMVKSFFEKLDEIQALAKLMQSKIFINDENEELWDSMAQSNYLKKYWTEQRRVQAENPNKEFSSTERAEIEKKRIAKERGL